MRIYEAGGATKNEQFRQMLAMASARGFEPTCVLFDAWYSSLENLKAVRTLGWVFLTRLMSNRSVNPDRQRHVRVSEVEVGPAGRIVQLKGFGLVRLFRTVSQDGHAEYWATNGLEMTAAECAAYEQQAWGIESYHRSLKQHWRYYIAGGAERSQVRSAIGQGNHLLLSVRAYLRLEVHRIRTGMSHFEAKASIIRGAIRVFLADPALCRLASA